MNRLLFSTLLTLLIALPLSSFGQKPHKAQKKFFPKELRKEKIYFGMPKAKLLRAFPNAQPESSSFDFREVYIPGQLSERIQDSRCYLDNEGELPVYEFILVMAEGHSNEALGRELFGTLNHEGKEWRFKPAETGLDFEIAAWTFQNKLIIAAAWPGSEWEEGF